MTAPIPAMEKHDSYRTWKWGRKIPHSGHLLHT